MVSVEIGAVRLLERKTIPYLRRVIQKLSSEWNIKNENVRAAVTDGGANIKGAVKEEFPHRHLTCIGHLLDNVGQKVMKPTATYSVPSEREDATPEVDLPETESDTDEDDNEDEWEDAIDKSHLGALIKESRN